MSISIESLEQARDSKAIVKEVPISCAYTVTKLNWKAITHGLGVALSVIRIRFRNGLLRGTKHIRSGVIF